MPCVESTSSVSYFCPYTSTPNPAGASPFICLLLPRTTTSVLPYSTSGTSVTSLHKLKASCVHVFVPCSFLQSSSPDDASSALQKVHLESMNYKQQASGVLLHSRHNSYGIPRGGGSAAESQEYREDKAQGEVGVGDVMVCSRTQGCAKAAGHQGFCSGHKGFRRRFFEDAAAQASGSAPLSLLSLHCMHFVAHLSSTCPSASSPVVCPSNVGKSFTCCISIRCTAKKQTESSECSLPGAEHVAFTVVLVAGRRM